MWEIFLKKDLKKQGINIKTYRLKKQISNKNNKKKFVNPYIFSKRINTQKNGKNQRIYRLIKVLKSLNQGILTTINSKF